MLEMCAKNATDTDISLETVRKFPAYFEVYVIRW